MLDWTAFEDACAARERPAILASACARAWGWLDLDSHAREALLENSISSIEDARTMWQALDILRRRVTPDGVSGVPASGDAGSRAGAVQHLQQVVSARLEAASASESHERERLFAVTTDVSAALESAGGPFVNLAAYEGLAKAVDALAAAGLSLGPVVAKEHAWWMGLALWGLATAAQGLGRFDEAREAFVQAAVHYDAAGEADSAGQCRGAERALANRLRGDFDAAQTPDLRALLTRQAPFEKMATLSRLSREASRAGDRYEAARLGEEVAALLCDLGYPDPEYDFDTAYQAWLDTTTGGNGVVDPFKQLCDVIGHWAVVLGARTNERLLRDSDGSLRAERAMRALTAELIPELTRRSEHARHAALERLVAWEPSLTEVDTATRENAIAADTATVQSLNDALYALRLACNESPQPSQLDEADRLLARADAIGSGVHAASASIERAYILNALGRHEDAPAAADAGIERLLDRRPPQLGSFATSYERELYLMAVLYKARAAAAQRDSQRILAICVPVMLDIESERLRVNSPYQQSATLATRTEVYEMVAAAAWRTGDGDLLLDTTERLKARAALASRLRSDDSGPAPVDQTEALREWQAVNEALRTAAGESAEAAALRERRRWLATVVAIERAARAGVPESLTIAAIAAALAPDEAAISWFWLGDDAVIVQAFTRDAHDVEVVPLDERHKAQLHGYLESIPGLGTSSTKHARLESLIDSLGEVLLPARLRSLVADHPRLILSPHRSLHLFPFHAVPWTTGTFSGRLIQHVAVRYVPNLTSLLLPWVGPTRGRVLSVGMGRFEGRDLATLPEAEAEAAAVAMAHGTNGDVLLDPDRATLLERLSAEGYRCLHLATHGSSVLAADAVDDPQASHLCLRDGDFSAWDLATLDLPLELVALAACHSGQRAVAGRGLAALPGDDLFGLQAAMFEAGVWGVLGALWPVDDEVASEIMIDVHRAYAGGASPDVALHEAIRTHLATPGRRRSIYYWAPFTLTTLGRHPGFSSRPPESSRPG